VRVTVKICGLTNADDARAAAAEGADFLGFVFFPASRRAVGLPAPPWIHAIEGRSKVGVFRDQGEEAVVRVRDEAGLDLVQLHGSEPPEMCEALGGRARVIKAVPVERNIDWGRVREYSEVARIVFDTASSSGGGTGTAFDWGLLVGSPPRLEFWLAGGLTPENVARAVTELSPIGVDVASGVEAAPGRKDVEKIRRFIAAVRSVRRFEGSTVRTLEKGRP
jgi:phosphoribosylanthranilate isomerase